MRVYPGSTDLGTMAAQTDVTVRMTGLARLQVAPCLAAVVAGPHVRLAGTVRQVRLDLKAAFRKTVVTRVAEFLVMAAVACLWIV